MNKIFLAITLLMVSLSSAFASDIKLKILDARYNEVNDSLDVDISYIGGCEDKHSLRLRGCAELMFPIECQVDVVIKRGADCNENVLGTISYTLSELGMKNRRFSRATLIVQDPKKTSKAMVRLPINR